MILRNKRISKQANEIQLSVCYGIPDVKRMVQWIFYLFHHDCDYLYQSMLKMPQSEMDIIEIFVRDKNCFGNYGLKWARPLAEWAFNVCLREKFIIRSATTENQYYFTEKCLTKKRGRPTNNN